MRKSKKHRSKPHAVATEKRTDQKVDNADALSETKESTSLDSQKPNEQTMEVHHHAHIHSKSKWKEYVFQFFMLFLAVFCGFLAEYQLEHKIESDRSKELARSLYYELRNDSINIQQKAQSRIKQENALKYLMKYFADSSITDVSKAFQINFSYGIMFRSPSIFEPRTVVLDQLKNSGSLRYFKNDELQKLIGDISVAIHNISDRQDLEAKLRLDMINPLQVRHYDFDFNSKLTHDGEFSIFDEMIKYEKSNEFIPFQFKVPEKLDREAVVNELGHYCYNALNSTRTLHFKRYMEVNARLLQILREEFHIN